jgi:hypothetical protein
MIFFSHHYEHGHLTGMEIEQQSGILQECSPSNFTTMAKGIQKISDQEASAVDSRLVPPAKMR